MGTDNAFIRLKKDFALAKVVSLSKQATELQFDCICLDPTENYLQTTNSDEFIDFDNDYKVSVIDTCGNELSDITDRVTIRDFIDRYGKHQASFEILPLQVEFNHPVCLKIEHTTGTEIFYSNPFHIASDRLGETIHVSYKSEGYFAGVDYTNAPHYQSIRVMGRVCQPDDTTDEQRYTQTTGNVYSRNPIMKSSRSIKLDSIHDLAFYALKTALKNDLCFVDGIRVTDKPNIKTGDLIGGSNQFSGEATAAFDMSDTYANPYQITDPFEISAKTPSGSINVDYSDANPITITFNGEVTIGSGDFRIYKSTELLVATLNQTDFETFASNAVRSTAAISDYITDNTDYYIQFDSGLFVSDIGETISITNTTDWTFSIAVGDWLGTDWAPTDFLIHS